MPSSRWVGRSLFLTLAAAAAAGVASPSLVACRGELDASGSLAPSVDAGSDAEASAPAPLPDEDRPLIPATKVDVLLVVDNSSSMADKSTLLAGSLGTLLREVAKVGDVHLGVISTSLGSMGGDVCDPTNPENDGHGHLRDNGPDGQVVPGLQNGVLALSGGSVDAFVASAATLVRGVGEKGCGFEAQLESAYRFLVQPDPWVSVKLDANMLADLGDGADSVLLAQRKAFLRPDSALVVLMLTDEDDSSADPLAVGGQGWAFESKHFPGSSVVRVPAAAGTTAPRGSSACAADPASPDCSSCGFKSLCDPSAATCQRLRNDPVCTTSPVAGMSGAGYDGYYGPGDDDLNVRFFDMKQRFGIDPQYPLSRYVDGFTKSVVPNRSAEHVITGAPGKRTLAPYTGVANCTNPIFADELPSGAGDELCNLRRGPRSRELVVFALLGGVPEPLVSATPDWTRIVGRDPDAYDYSGMDPHMIPSTTPRPGLTGADVPVGDNGTDPINGREWQTGGHDLEYACTFPLPTPKTCAVNSIGCDCSPEDTANPPLCSARGTQTRGKAYPTHRELRVVRALGDRGVFGSICGASYDATMSALYTRLATRLAK